MIDPGQMRTKLVYQTNTPVQNSGGQPIESWSDTFTAWAKVSPLSGREAYWASQMHATTSHTVTMRYHHGVVPTGRFRFASDPTRILNVNGVVNTEERNIELVISCVEANGES